MCKCARSEVRQVSTNTAASSLMLQLEGLESYFTAAWRKTWSSDSALYCTFKSSSFYRFIISSPLKPEGRVKVMPLSRIIFIIKTVSVNLGKTVETEKSFFFKLSFLNVIFVQEEKNLIDWLYNKKNRDICDKFSFSFWLISIIFITGESNRCKKKQNPKQLYLYFVSWLFSAEDWV